MINKYKKSYNLKNRLKMNIIKGTLKNKMVNKYKYVVNYIPLMINKI